MSFDDLTRPELEAKVWSQITTRIAIKSILMPSFYRMIEDAYDEDMKPQDGEKLDEIAEKHSKEFASAFFNTLEDQGFLTWVEDGGPIIANDLNISKMSDDDLPQVLLDIDEGKYDHYFSQSTET